MEIQLEKDEHEPLGLLFESDLISSPRLCQNQCVFCFIDQMPPGMRRTLYVKDDDWRMSLMMGNYITLTNLTETEFARVLKRRASPLYVSVHATDPAVRECMMNHRAAGLILEQLKRLAEHGIGFHCQVVLCPGLNDGPVLERTLADLADLHPYARSVALVPVGLTRYRDGLAPLTPFTELSAQALLRQVHEWQCAYQKRLGTSFVFAADEFYCLSGAPLPADEAYEDYPQLENGVGLLRQFETEYVCAYGQADFEDVPPRQYLLATGVSGAPFLQKLLKAHPVPGVNVAIVPIHNRFFGETVTVAGLVTGRDLVEQLQGRHGDAVLIPQSMLQEDSLFLDNLSLKEASAALGISMLPIPCDGAALLDTLLGMED